MNSRNRFLVTLFASAVVLLVLIRLPFNTSIEAGQWQLIIVFGCLIIFTTIFGVALGGGIASLQPMVTMAAYLVLGMAPAGWLAFLAAIPHSILRYYFSNRLGLPRPANRFGLLALAPANATMHGATILASGAVFESLGGITPLTAVDASQILPLIAFGLTYFAVNHLIAAVYFSLRGRKNLQSHLGQLHKLFLYEVTPMMVTPLIALIFTRLGGLQFTLFALLLVGLSLITHNLDQTRQRLERRVRELDGLQSVGQALSASLDLDTILSTIYTQVTRLMPASTFYVALYNEETSEISFPFAVDEHKLESWPSRRVSNGFTEHVLWTRRPLLVQDDLGGAIERLGLEPVIMNEAKQLAASWLGVPIIAGEELLGMISVQSRSRPAVYDEMHRDILVTIAAQAAVAIQNAKLFASTDSALTRRVQELDSIFETTRDGLLLLDLYWRILAANPAFAQLTDLSQGDLIGKLITDWLQGERPIISCIGYSEADLRADCDKLTKGEDRLTRQVQMAGAPERYFFRTLAPVYAPDRRVDGWLLVFRDNTEEIELSRLREDMTHMLVHDLRSPLSVIMGSLETSRAWLEAGRMEEAGHTLKLAGKSGDRMMHLVNNLLDVYRFESGQVPLYRQPVSAAMLLAEARTQCLPLLDETSIKVELESEPGLPHLLVDFECIIRVLQNLLDNAIKFTPDGGFIRLWTRLDNGFSPSMALLGVSDDGTGVPPEEQGRIFEKFQHGLARNGRRAGTGLGLSFCKLVVEAHGGEIWVESSGVPGEGSTFVMRLPIVNGELSK